MGLVSQAPASGLACPKLSEFHALPDPSANPPRRSAARAIQGFLIRIVRISGALHRGNIWASVMLLSLKQAESTPGPISAAIKRPISIRALALSLTLPYETARRHMRGLLDRRLCVREGRSGYTTGNGAAARKLLALQYRLNAEAFIEMLADMRAAGVDLDKLAIVPGAVPRPENSGANRLDVFFRVANDFTLRLIEAGIAIHGNSLERGIVFVTIAGSNTNAIWRDPELANRYGDTILPDGLRVPVSMGEVARLTQMPKETVRRYANQLLREGDCVRVGKLGLIVPARVHERVTSVSQLYFVRLTQALTALKAGGIDLARLDEIGQALTEPN